MQCHLTKNYTPSSNLLTITLAANRLTRLTGIEFQDGGRPFQQLAPEGIIHVDGRTTMGAASDGTTVNGVI